MMFEVFEHTADVGLRIRADSREGLFVDAARGLFSLLVANLSSVRPVMEREIRIAGAENDLLLFDWLNELLYVFDTRHVVLAEFHVDFRDGELVARCLGEPVDRARHVLEHEVKAITYHGLKVESGDGRWLAEVIVDI
jgi:SHS2 domain-containing protein